MTTKPYRPGRLLQHIAKEYPIEEGFSLRAFEYFKNGNPNPRRDWGMIDVQRPGWLHRVRNTCSGRTFMFGTGPSLVSQLPLLPAMKDEHTWTVNRMRRWYEKGALPFIPNNHIVAEPGPCPHWGKMVLPPYDFPEATNRIAINWWPVTAPGWLWCPKAPDDIQMRWQDAWGCGDYLPPLPTGWASPLTGAQLALWMGYDEIIFLGIDTTQDGQAWDVEDGRTLVPRSIRSICESFDRFRIYVQRHGRKVWDCTPGGRINEEGILPYRDLEEILHERK